MKRFSALAGALRLAGSLPFPYPRRGDVGVIATYAGEALAPFDFDKVRLVPRTRTFSGALGLDVGGREVRLMQVGPAHTPGDLIASVPDARIAIAADILFIGITPIMWAGPLEGWVAALERLLGLGAERFVPGHGPVCGPEEVRRLIDYWRWLDQAARQRLDSGMSPAETARELVLGEEIVEPGFADWLAPERALVSVGTIDAHRARRRQATRAARADHRVLPYGAPGPRSKGTGRGQPAPGRTIDRQGGSMKGRTPSSSPRPSQAGARTTRPT
jgi:glyoxylase-like metal-dependent hydrolase (beta-lactamase superfamily II)